MNLNEAVVEYITKFCAKTDEAGSSAIFNTIVEKLATQTLDKRITRVIEVYTEITNQMKDLKKIRPDMVSFNEDGSPAQQHYSKAKLEEKKKIVERITKLEKALNLALSGNDWELINDLNVKSAPAPAEG